MFRNNKKLLLILGLFLIISNLPPIKPLLEMFFSYEYIYVSDDLVFIESEIKSKGRNYDEVLRWFDYYKKECKQPDAIVYRAFRINPLKFWLWWEFLTHPKFRLPYKKVPQEYFENHYSNSGCG